MITATNLTNSFHSATSGVNIDYFHKITSWFLSTFLLHAIFWTSGRRLHNFKITRKYEQNRCSICSIRVCLESNPMPVLFISSWIVYIKLFFSRISRTGGSGRFFGEPRTPDSQDHPRSREIPDLQLHLALCCIGRIGWQRHPLSAAQDAEGCRHQADSQGQNTSSSAAGQQENFNLCTESWQELQEFNPCTEIRERRKIFPDRKSSNKYIKNCSNPIYTGSHRRRRNDE